MDENSGTSQMQSVNRKIEYKRLLEVGGHIAENAEISSTAEIVSAVEDLVTKTNVLYNQGKEQAPEALLDAQVLKLASDVMGTTVRRIENDNFSDDVFAAALLAYVKDDDTNVHDWSKLDEIAARKSKSVFFTPSMFGTFDFNEIAEASQPSQKQRRVRRANGMDVEKRPISTTASGTSKTGSTKVESVLKIIKDVYRKNGEKPIPYFKLVIDPTNMMYTFDNTFQVSFLFRDGCIAFVKDEDGLPAIKPMDEEAMKAPKPKEMTSFTSALNHNLIQKYIKKYDIREPMLKPKQSKAQSAIPFHGSLDIEVKLK